MIEIIFVKYSISIIEKRRKLIKILLELILIPSMCWSSFWDNEGFLGILGDLHRGGVEHVSTNSSLSILFGTKAPTNNLSVEPSSIPRPSHRPQGNLKVCPVTSFRTTTCSTIHFGDTPALSWPMRKVDKTPRFLC